MSDAIGPLVIPDTAIPIIDTTTPAYTGLPQTTTTTSPESANALTPTAISSKPVDIPPVAVETISQSLDTKSRRILGAYTFGQVGAIQIGTYKFGVSGQISISPDGIVAEDVNGNITFSLDGTTGDAVFKGTVEAADFTIIDAQGLVSLSAFATNSVDVLTPHDLTTGTYTDITDGTTPCSLTFDLGRAINVLIFVTARVQLTNMVNTDTPTGLLILNIDGIIFGNMVLEFVDVEIYTPGVSGNYSRVVSLSGQQLIQLAAGTHTIKMQGKVITAASAHLAINDITMTYLTLGS